MGSRGFIHMVDFLQEVRTQGDAQQLITVLLIGFQYGANSC